MEPPDGNVFPAATVVLGRALALGVALRCCVPMVCAIVQTDNVTVTLTHATWIFASNEAAPFL